MSIIRDADYMLNIYNTAMSDGNLYEEAEKVVKEVLDHAEKRANNGYRESGYTVQDYTNPKPICKVAVKVLKELGFNTKLRCYDTFNTCGITIKW